ncbi:MAG: RNA-directed DNA polymerase [Acidobacteria bacterium]|nr:RNA-directed DNA polymerase [Acidobacteriota bacterium]
MHNQKAKRARWRALLTDTLPYEVPVIFSNDRRFAALVSDLDADPSAILFEKLVPDSARGTIPYDYSISKETGKRTTLSIVHPVSQMRIAEFYEAYSQTMVDYCSRSEFTLRAPVSPTMLLSADEMSGEKTFKLGIPHVAAQDGEIDVSHVVSYFSYGRYSLLSKFIESSEFVELEKRFELLRTLDVSKCFFSIYTHTISWAVKGRDYAKQYSNAYSFEARFDSLMQGANHKETHGIVVGPEISRIFAEIILQDIDRCVMLQLREEKLDHGKHYAVRRYVDDFYVFARDTAVLARVEEVIRAQLQRHKLYLNESKVVSFSRPFVSGISMARKELAAALAELRAFFDDLPDLQVIDKLRRRSRVFRQKIKDVRFIAAQHQVGFHTLSGWLLSSLRGLLGRASEAVGKEAENPERAELLTEVAADVLTFVFYVCALDTRVRTSYSLCQMLSVVRTFGGGGGGVVEPDHLDRLRHVAAEGLHGLISSLSKELSSDHDSVELYNLLICGAQYIGPEFFSGGPSREALYTLAAQKRPTYFAYVTAKFCLLKDRAANQRYLDDLNRNAIDKVADGHRLFEDADRYLLFCDLVSSPDLSHRLRRDLVVAVLKGNPSNESCSRLADLVGFVDWSGTQIEHTLERRQLRPVYAFV